jgi:hypothetical protein
MSFRLPAHLLLGILAGWLNRVVSENSNGGERLPEAGQERA